MTKETNAKKRKVLYLPSTPLNLLVSVAHAVAYSSEQVAQIVLIDQKTRDDNVYFKALKAWDNSPFENVELTLGVAKGKDKLKERKINFRVLSDLIERFPADTIAVGSDRRVEFQYLMHLRSKNRELGQVEGWYLDDGLYSYAGRPYKWFKDSINGLLKKLVYGFWWEEPKTIGASSWIKRAWLFRHQQAVAALQMKQLHSLPSHWFVEESIQLFSQNICSAYGLDEGAVKKIQATRLFLLIPHPNNIKKMRGYEDKIHFFLNQLCDLGIHFAVKYHPRTEQRDILRLEEKYQALLVPSGLAFEFILPFLKSSRVIVGDVGTALLTAQWLRSDLKVCAVLNESDSFQDRFKLIYEKLGINLFTDFKNILTLLTDKKVK